MSKLHELKTSSKLFQDVWSTRKLFELRKDDRRFAMGDVLLLREFVPDEQPHLLFTGRRILVLVIYILRNSEHLKPGYCAMGLKLLARLQAEEMPDE